MSDWDIRGQDIDQQYAPFCVRAFSAQKIWNLSAASILESKISCALYLTYVSTTTVFAEVIRDWAYMAAVAANSPKHRRGGHRATRLARIPEAAIKQAGYDGALLALFGAVAVTPLRERARQFQIDREAYQRVRDAVGTDAVNRIAIFRHALAFMHGYVRDRTYEQKLKTANIVEHDTFLIEEDVTEKKRLHWGCYLTPSRDSDSPASEQTSLADEAMSHRGLYDERYEARMRAESQEDKSPQGKETPGEYETRGGS